MEPKTYEKGQLYLLSMQDDIYFKWAGVRVRDYFKRREIPEGRGKEPRIIIKYECLKTIKIIPGAIVFVEGIKIKSNSAEEQCPNCGSGLMDLPGGGVGCVNAKCDYWDFSSK